MLKGLIVLLMIALLIIVGPTLILFGMIVNLFAKMDFEDQRED